MYLLAEIPTEFEAVDLELSNDVPEQQNSGNSSIFIKIHCIDREDAIIIVYVLSVYNTPGI